MSVKSWKDRRLAKFFTRFPFLVNRWAKSTEFIINLDTPWAVLTKDLAECRIGLVTTAGVHLRSQPPFDMKDKDGDATWREIPSQVDQRNLIITHNYYDHGDADLNINVVFPADRLKELAAGQVIGGGDFLPSLLVHWPYHRAAYSHSD